MADLFTFPELPRDRRTIPLFQTPRPGDRMKEARKLAEKFGVKGEIREAGSSLLVSDARANLEVFHASDSLRWSTLHLRKSETDKIEKLPDDGAAAELAAKYLKAQGISLAEASLHNVTRSELSRLGPRGKEPEVMPVAVHVNYRYALKELPVFGPGAKIQVTLGGGGKVAEFYQFWRKPKAAGERELIPLETIVALLRRDPIFEQLRPEEAQVRFDSVRLGYFALAPRERQGMLVPVYAFRGTVSTRALERYEFVRYAVAVKLDSEEVKRDALVSRELAPLFE